MTQLQKARQGIITEHMRAVADHEQLEVETLRQLVADGKVVIPANVNRGARPAFGVGAPLRVKVNANIGTSPQNSSIEHELAKLEIVEQLGAESVMDLSIGDSIDATREALIERARVIVGTVPIYQVLTEQRGDVTSVGVDTILETIEKHGRQGVDFITVHCGLTRAALPLVENRSMGIVSRGGSFLARWMVEHQRENPLYEHFDQLLAIAKQYDMTLSLGDALRPGALVDGTDRAQLHELFVLGELSQRARQADVQVIVEGPGHLPLDQIEQNVSLQRQICQDAPFYLLGPLTTDVAPGYDHIVGAIGGALAAYFGAAFLCYVTPAEHLRLPSIDDVREGVIASKIAAHTADLARGKKAAWDRDRRFAQLRRSFDWEGMFQQAIDGRKPRRYREESTHPGTDECSMCGEYCALKMYECSPRKHSGSAG